MQTIAQPRPAFAGKNVSNDQVVRNVLRPGFIPINRTFWQSIRRQLSPSEIEVLFSIIYFTTGFLRQWCIIGAEKLAEDSGVSRGYLFEVIKSLKAKGLIEVQRTKRSNRYRLGDLLEVLVLDPEDQPRQSASLVAKFPESAPVDGSQSYPPDSCIESKEITDQHHAPALPDTAAPVGGETASADFDDEFLSCRSSEDSAPKAKPGHSLVNALRELGVNQFVAYKLVKSQPADKIAAAIERVKRVKTENPAGYLVAEIQRGGYAALVDKTVATRRLHEEIHQRRQVERELEQVENDQVHAQTLTALERYERLPADDQAELRRQVELQAQAEGLSARVRGWSESHPVFRGLLSELVARKLQLDQAEVS